MCIGAGFAAQTIRTVLAQLLQRFHVELCPGARIGRRGITLATKLDLPMRLVARRNAQVMRPAGGGIQELVELSC